MVMCVEHDQNRMDMEDVQLVARIKLQPIAK